MQRHIGVRIALVIVVFAATFYGQTAAPTINSLSSFSVQPGSSVTITGSNFTGTTGSVTFNGVAATINNWSDTSISAVVPTGAHSGTLIVIAGTEQSAGFGFQVPSSLPSRPSGLVIDAANPLSSNMVGLFLMNEGSGSTDKNVVNGQLANFSGSNPPTWNAVDPSTVFHGGANFNSSYLDAGTGLTFDRLPNSRMTVVAKIFVNTVAGAGIAQKLNQGAGSGFLFDITSQGQLRMQILKTSIPVQLISQTGTITSGQWMQVALTWDGTIGTGAAAHLYLNGNLLSPSSSSDGGGTLDYSAATNQPFQIGMTSSGSLDARMAYLAVYRDRILTPSELGRLDGQLPLTSDVVYPITESGAAVTGTTTVSGQGAQFQFQGWAGQQVVVAASNNQLGDVTVNLIKPDGTTLVSTSSSATNFNLPTGVLPVNGPYDVVVRPTGATNGTVTVSLSVQGQLRFPGSRVDDANPLSTNLVGLFLMGEGGGSTDKNVVDGQPANFSGTRPPTWNSVEPSIVFNGGINFNSSYLDAGTGLNFDRLPNSRMTVVAKIFVNTVAGAGIAQKLNQGAGSGFLFDITSQGQMRMQILRTSIPVQIISQPGTITSGQWMQVALTWDGTIATAAAAHFYLNGNLLSLSSSTNGGGTLDYSAATNQPFQIGMTSSGSLDGRMAYLAVYRDRILSPAELSQLDGQLPLTSDVIYPITESGAAVTATTTSLGQGAQFSFQGWAGQQVVVAVSNNQLGSVTVNLIKPDGTTLASTSSSSTNFSLPSSVLPVNGPYDVVVRPTGATSGNVTVSLSVQGQLRLPASTLDDANPLSTNLVGLFLMGEGSGSTDKNVVDGQPGNFSGTRPPSWNSAEPSIVFNGGVSNSSYLDAGTGLNFDRLPNSKMTVVAKIFVNTVAGAGIAQKLNQNAGSGFLFDITSQGQMRMQILRTSIPVQIISQPGTITSGQWMQVALTWDGTIGTAAAAHFYLNGNLLSPSSSIDGGGTLDYSAATNQPFQIGMTSSGSLDGRMAYLAVYRGRILTAAEMNQLDAQLPINMLDVNGTVPVSGSFLTNITTPGQNARLLLPVTGGQNIVAWLFNNTLGSVTATLLNTDGTVLSSINSSAQAFSPPPVVAPATGVYAVYLHPAGTNTGTVNVASTPPSIPTVSINTPLNGSSIYLSTAPVLSANAASTNGASVSKVEYFEGQTLVGQATVGPFSLTLNNPLPGSHTYTAKVTDSNGMIAQSSAVTSTFVLPQITGISPTYGQAGQSVTISGVGFGSSQNGAVVGFNGVPAEISGWGDGQVNAIVPYGAGSGAVGILFPDGSGSIGDPNFGPCSTGNGPNDPSCVISFEVSPGTITTDGAQTVSGAVAFSKPADLLELFYAPINIPFSCVAPASQAAGDSSGFGFNGGCYTGVPGGGTSVALTATFTAGSGPYDFLLRAKVGYTYDPGLTATLTVLNPGDINGSPDNGPCTECVEAGSPINLMTGNTYIAQSDYSLPGLGGGTSLVRTWNSQWRSTGPLTVAGMFGDSWRSTYEDRIQTTTTGVNYWLDDGKVWRFSLSNGVYTITSPPDARAALQLSAGQYTLTFPGGSKKLFDSNGYLTQVIDHNGNTTNVVYDSAHHITQVTDAGNRTLNFNYGDSANPNQVTSIQDSVGVIATYTYDSSSRLRTVTYADSAEVLFDYDTNSLITSVTDGAGVVLEAHTYDDHRRGLSSQRANGVDLVYVSYPSPGVTHVLDSGGHGTDYHHTVIGEKHFLASYAGPGCASCVYRVGGQLTHDASGNKTATFDAAGHVTQFTYDANGNVLTRSTPLNGHLVTWQYTYNSFNEVLTTTDPLGHVTTNSYDSNGNLLTVTSPSPDGVLPGSTTTFAYDPLGQLTSITDPLTQPTTLGYYATGLLHTITDAQNNVTTFVYDARGNRTDVYDAANNHTSFEYDGRNRLTKIHYPDTTLTTFGYDLRGQRTSVTDQNQKLTQYGYDDADRLLTVTDAAQNVTQYAYDPENNLTSITDANQHTTSFQYDDQGRVTQTTFPSTKVESYTYDNMGNLLTKTDRQNQTINYSYDVLGRLVSKSYPDSNSVSYSYDDSGKVLQVHDSTGSYGFAYDNMGRLIGTTTQYSFLPGITYSNAYGYDTASNRTSFTAPDSSTNTYAYDTLNRLTTLTDSGAGQFTMGYDTLSRRTQLTRPNGITTSYGYDPVSHLQSILHKLGANTLDGATYGYDLAGNRTSKTNQLNSTVSNYGYDNIYQLTGVTQGASSTEAYSFDPVGNRLSSLSVPTYVYNSSNELTAAASAASYTYDNNGNTLTKTDSTGTMAYTWDFENRLTSVHPPSQTTVTFKYDPFGRRIQKGGSVYMYDGANLIEEADAAGNLVVRYVFGSGIDESLAASRGATWEFYQADGLGSITSLSTTAGTLSDSFVYDSFGNVTSSTGTFAQPFRYTGREWDAETGLYYYRARYFDPSAGRFLSEDPIRFQGGANFYRYTHNSPLNWIDPSGDDDECYDVPLNGRMTKKPCVDPKGGSSCIYVPGGMHCAMKVPSGPPLPSLFEDHFACPCGDWYLDRERHKIFEELDDKVGRVGSFGVAGTTSFFITEQILEHVGQDVIGEAIPFLDAGLTFWHMYEIYEAWDEAHQKLDKLYAPCKR
jgi:RHS repeat-associated protein